MSRRAIPRLALSVLLTVSLGAGFRLAPPAGAKAASNRGSGSLYLLEPASHRVLRPLDPSTLADMPDSPGITLGARSPLDLHAWLLVSPRGSRLARVSYLGSNAVPGMAAKYIAVEVFDLPVGRRQARFHPQVAILADGLSPDGSLLYGPGLSDGHRTVWYALDTSHGRVRFRVLLHNRYTRPLSYDAARQRLFAVEVRPFDSQTHQPRPLVLREYDVASGRQIAALTLPGILAGTGDTGRQVNGHEVYAEWSPGFALTPDGSEVAVLDGNTDTLWLIDARRLTVIRTEEVTRAASPLQRLGEWLGLVPAVALAKGGEGAVLSLHMSPDGRTLYATGRRGEITADGTVAMHFLPLQAIDVAHGTILAETPAADGWLGLSPDGSALYTLTGEANPDHWVLRRENPATLQPVATRTFEGYPQLLLLGFGA